MLFQDLRQNLKTQIAPAYHMSGADMFLINKSIDHILSAAGVNPLAVSHLAEGAQMPEINALLQNVTMFGNCNCVLLRASNDATVYLKPIKSQTEIEKVDCAPMSADLVVRMIMQNKKYSQNSATLLAQMCENNFTAVNNEMEKLNAYCADMPSVTVEIINEIVTKTESFQIYELTNSVLKRDIVRTQKILSALGAAGVEDYAIFGNLLSFARRLFYAKATQKPDAEVAKFLACAPFAITATRRDAKHISPDRAAEIYNNALKLEYEIKGGKIYANRAVILLVGQFA
jgi:DNA polymerase III delta subunit